MAIEAVAVSEGSGKNIAVDTVDSKEFQIIKLALGADGALDNLVDAGQQLSAASLPVVIASDQSDVPITLDGEAVVLGAGSAVVGIARLQDAGGDEISVAAFPGADDAALPNTLAVAAFPLMFDGTAWDRLRGDATNGLLVNLGSNNDITLATLPDTAAGDLAALVVDAAAIEALLTTIDGVLDTIKVDTEAIETAVEAIQAAQLADGHNVTIDNSTGAAAVNIQDGGNTITIDGTVTANLGAVDNAVLDAIESAVDGIEGLLTTIDADTGGILTAIQIMDDWDNGASDGASVSGDVAHDTTDAGEPVKVGMKAVDLGATPTAVAANDRTNWYASRAGVPFVLGGHPNIISKSLQITDADGAATDVALVTVAAGTAIVVTKVSVMADNANTVDVSVRIGFGTTNTPAVDAAGVILFHPGIAPGSGLVEGSGAGIIGIGASNEDLRVTCEDPVTGSINITVTYFTVLIG